MIPAKRHESRTGNRIRAFPPFSRKECGRKIIMVFPRRTHTIENDLIRLITVVLLSSILLCTIISNVMLYKINQENVERYNNDMLSQISQSSSSYFLNMNHTIYNFTCSNQVQAKLVQASKSRVFSSATSVNLRDFLILLSYSLPDCELHLFMETPSVLPVHLTNINFVATPGYHYKDDLWYAGFSSLPQERMVHITTPDECHYSLNGGNDGLTVIYRIRNNSNLNTIGYLLVDVSERVLEQTLNLRKQEQFYLKIETSDGKLILNTVPDNRRGNLFEMTAYEPAMGWTLTAYTQNDYFESNALIVMCFIVLSALLIGMGAFFFSAHFARSLTEPLKVLTSSMQEMESGSFGKLIYCKADNEIGYLIDQYNSMNRKIDELTKKKETAELAQKNAYIAVLQNQINPHFLYNTLEIIRGIADGPSADIIRNCCNALSRMFRYNLKAAGTATLNQELEQNRYYIYIMQLRFDYLFQAEFQIDETLLQYKIIRFSLQPFIENAIIHGFTDHQQRGTLSVSIRRNEDSRIRIGIRDDGHGMSPEELSRLKHALCPASDNDIPEAEENGIGIANTHKRFLSYFGADYEIRLESSPGKGTSVVLLIPRILI